MHGGLSSWGDWTACDKTCGGGFARRYRTCDNPPPKNGGRLCIGSLVEEIKCNVHFCPGKKYIYVFLDL